MRLLALEWDDLELRAVAARTTGNKLTLERTWSLPLSGSDTATVTQALHSITKDLGSTRIETLVAVGRASLELRVLTIPYAPPDEMPDLVRFQAMRQFSTLGEEWAVDYVMLADRGDEGLTVLAAALSPDSINALQAPCEQAGLNVKCLGLRPFAASAVLREEGPDDRCRLMVDILSGEADLTVIAGGLAVLPRTIRLPQTDDEEVLRQVIKGEIRRTMIAASNQLGGRRVDDIIIFGNPARFKDHAATLTAELAIPVNVLDPFAALECDAAILNAPPERPGRFAPLLGLLIDEAANCRPQIDFLHPHRRPAPKDNRRIYSLAALTSIVVLLLPVIWIYFSLWSMSGEIEKLRNDVKKLDREIQGYQGQIAAVESLEQFEAGNIRWLDELAWMSQQFPPAEKATVNDFIATVQSQGGGVITVQAAADATSTVASMEPALSDARHTIRGSGAKADPKPSDLPWRFSKTITIEPPNDEEEQPAAPAPEATTVSEVMQGDGA